MNAAVFHEKGMFFLRQGDLSAALEHLNRALEIAPDHPDYLSDRAVVYFHLSRFDLALLDMDRAMNLDPHNGYRYSSRAYVRERMGDLEGAMADYRKAIEIDPEDAVSYNNLGLIEEKLGYMKSAKRNFEQADHLADEQGVFGEKKNPEKAEKFVMMKNPIPDEKQEEAAKKKPGRWAVIRSVFSSREGLRDFLRFIKNGFRL